MRLFNSENKFPELLPLDSRVTDTWRSHNLHEKSTNQIRQRKIVKQIHERRRAWANGARRYLRQLPNMPHHHHRWRSE